MGALLYIVRWCQTVAMYSAQPSASVLLAVVNILAKNSLTMGGYRGLIRLGFGWLPDIFPVLPSVDQEAGLG
jgi:hypothetical protein